MDYYSYYDYCYPDYLMHYGVKGMKWGHRRARSQAYVDASNRARMAKSDYKQAKRDVRAAAKAERNTPEAIAARKAKQKKALKIGAAVAGTALAIYGAKKLNDYVKDNHSKIEALRGHDDAERTYEYLKKNALARDITPGAIKETITLNSNSGIKGYEAGVNARKDNFRTAAKNVIDYRKQNGKRSLNRLRSVDAYRDLRGSSITFEKKRR